MMESLGRQREESLSAKRLTATFERCQETVVVRFGGEMDFYSVESFKPKLARVCRAGVHNFIFDLNGMRYLDSAGLGFLFATSQELKSKGGRLVCISPTNPFVQKSLDTNRAAALLDLVRSEDEALRFFQYPSGAVLPSPPEETE